MDQNLSDRIRERAYELWAASGYRDGEAEQHWLAAERKILTASLTAVPRQDFCQTKSITRNAEAGRPGAGELTAAEVPQKRRRR
jgi:hypothetical protein